MENRPEENIAVCCIYFTFISLYICSLFFTFENDIQLATPTAPNLLPK